MSRAIQWLCAFFSNKSDQSMTRAITLILTIAAFLLCYAIYRVATRASLHDAPATIAAIGGCLAPVIAGGIVALAKRTKVTDQPKETP